MEMKTGMFNGLKRACARRAVQAEGIQAPKEPLQRRLLERLWHAR